MHSVPNNTTDTVGRTLTGWALLRLRISNWLVRIRRKLPYIIWYGQEVDVGVTIQGIASIEDMTLAVDHVTQRYPGRKQIDISKIYEAQQLFRDLGITFDSGSGMHGRDWEWDWSLKGPINVKFHGKAERPEQRTAIPPKTKLIIVK